MKPLRCKADVALVDGDGNADLYITLWFLKFVIRVPRFSICQIKQLSDAAIAEDDLTNVIKFPRWRT